MLTKRTNILLDKELWEKVTFLAQSQNVSIGEIMRSAVREKYERDQMLARRKRAMEDIERIRPHFKGKIDYKALINYGRK